jgi:hypothetical protein
MQNIIIVISMGETSKKVDSWFEKIEKYVTAKIGAFVAFLFLLYAAGALTAIVIMTKYPQQVFLVALIPAAAGVLAYYNRAFATIAFFVLMLTIFIL